MWAQVAGGQGSSVSSGPSSADQGGDYFSQGPITLDAMNVNRGNPYLPLALVGLGALALVLVLR